MAIAIKAIYELEAGERERRFVWIENEFFCLTTVVFDVVHVCPMVIVNEEDSFLVERMIRVIIAHWLIHLPRDFLWRRRIDVVHLVLQL